MIKKAGSNTNLERVEKERANSRDQLLFPVTTWTGLLSPIRTTTASRLVFQFTVKNLVKLPFHEIFYKTEVGLIWETSFRFLWQHEPIRQDNQVSLSKLVKNLVKLSYLLPSAFLCYVCSWLKVFVKLPSTYLLLTAISRNLFELLMENKFLTCCNFTEFQKFNMYFKKMCSFTSFSKLKVGNINHVIVTDTFSYQFLTPSRILEVPEISYLFLP